MVWHDFRNNCGITIKSNNMANFDVFSELLNKLENMEGKSITLTKADCPNDNFLIFGFGYDEHTITFKRRWRDNLWMVCIKGDEPILLEDCPPSFYRTLVNFLP